MAKKKPEAKKPTKPEKVEVAIQEEPAVVDEAPVEVAAGVEIVTADDDVEIEELPGGGTRETARKSRRYQ